MVTGHVLYGSGPEHVMVLPGAPGDHSSFSPLFPFLDAATFTYACIDYRGVGRSRRIAGNYTIAELTGDILDVADHLKWQQFHVVGHSFGGMLAQRLAVDAQQRIKSAITAAPVPACGLHLDEAGRTFMLSAVENNENLRTAMRQVTGNRLSAAWIDWLLKRARETTTRKALRGYMKLAMDEDFADRLAGISTPFLVLVGEHDPVYTATLMRSTLAAWLPNAAIEVLANCSHYPMQEIPAYFATRIEEFMKKKG